MISRSSIAAFLVLAPVIAFAQPQTPSKPTTGQTAGQAAGQTTGQTVGQAMGDIVTQPLQDANIKQKRIPEVLELARDGPYETTGLNKCPSLNRAIADLTAVLGADFDTPDERKVNRGQQAANVGKGVVQSLIPFRGVIREVTGAAGAQRKYDAAVDAGIARRGFLRGMARARGCKMVS